LHVVEKIWNLNLLFEYLKLFLSGVYF